MTDVGASTGFEVAGKHYDVNRRHRGLTHLDTMGEGLQKAGGSWVYTSAPPFQPACIQVNSDTSQCHLRWENDKIGMK